MSAMIDDHEIQSIIARVKGRVAATHGGGDDGKALRAAAEIEAADALLGDGIHPTIDAAVGAARRAFESFRENNTC